MFNLENAIGAWKRPFESLRAVSEEDLRELENHLRDEYEDGRDNGLDEETAFRLAVTQVDDVFFIEQEYRKVFWQKTRRSGLITTEIRYTGAMIKNYFIVALRNIRRHKGYAFINVFGLSLGIAICLLLLLFVRKETGFDHFHAKGDRIVRLISSKDGHSAEEMSPELRSVLLDDFPGIETVVRFRNLDGQLIGTDAEQDDATGFYEDRFLYADSGFFDVFSFPLLRGEAEQAFAEPFSVVLTASMADKYFGSEDPLGRPLFVGDGLVFTVTGVAEDPPDASSIQFNFVSPFSTLRQHPNEKGMLDSGWYVTAYSTYAMLAPTASVDAISSVLKEGILRHNGDADWVAEYDYSLEKLRDIHFSKAGNRLGTSSDVRYVYIFASVAFLILLIACINYVNLSTARATQRAREVGIRKVVGAHRSLLARQFLSESTLLSFLALAIAFAIVYPVLPIFSSIVDRSITFDQFDSFGVWGMVVALVLFVGVAAGLYPALFLSGFEPARVLKRQRGRSGSGSLLRKSLVVFQFSISLFMLVGAIVVQQQLEYIQTKDLGLDQDRVLVLPLKGEAQDQALAVRDLAGRLSGVASASLSGAVPSKGGARFGVNHKEKQIYVSIFPADTYYLETLGITVSEGRNFSDDFDDTSGRSVRVGGAIVNRTLVESLELENPMEDLLPVKFNGNEYRIIGIVDDFHIASLEQEIAPVAIVPIEDYWTSNLVLRLATDDYSDVLDNLNTAWKSTVPGIPFEYYFLDDSFDALYKGPVRLARIFNVFSTIAILIACLGLFGLASFTAEVRTHEIGIRKVLGATMGHIVGLMTTDFMKLVAIAFIVASPLAWIVMNRWLDGFAYRIEINAGTYIIAALLTAAFAVITVSWQAVRAASGHPVEALRRE